MGVQRYSDGGFSRTEMRPTDNEEGWCAGTAVARLEAKSLARLETIRGLTTALEAERVRAGKFEAALALTADIGQASLDELRARLTEAEGAREAVEASVANYEGDLREAADMYSLLHAKLDEAEAVIKDHGAAVKALEFQAAAALYEVGAKMAKVCAAGLAVKAERDAERARADSLQIEADTMRQHHANAEAALRDEVAEHTGCRGSLAGADANTERERARADRLQREADGLRVRIQDDQVITDEILGDRNKAEAALADMEKDASDEELAEHYAILEAQEKQDAAEAEAAALQKRVAELEGELAISQKAVVGLEDFRAAVHASAESFPLAGCYACELASAAPDHVTCSDVELLKMAELDPSEPTDGEAG